MERQHLPGTYLACYDVKACQVVFVGGGGGDVISIDCDVQ